MIGTKIFTRKIYLISGFLHIEFQVKQTHIILLGLVTPLGCEIEEVWRRLTKGECGVSAIESKGEKSS